jgi:3-oxoacyl-[acyl-carrier-protein] synthase II
MKFGRKVVVTGMGAVSNVGTTVAAFWESLVQGRSGVDTVRSYDATGYPVRIAGEVKEENLYSLLPAALPPCPFRPKVHRAVLMTVAAAGQAVLEAGLDPRTWNPRKVGLYFGNGIGTMHFPDHALAVPAAFPGGELSYPDFLKSAAEVFDPSYELEYEADVSLEVLSAGWNIQGPCNISLTACAASTQAIGEACHWIGEGRVDTVIAGGGHSIVDVFGMTGFGYLTACSTRNEEPQKASRPFDRDRDGFVLAEGAGMLVLEAEETARARGAEILAEIEGYGLSTDAYRVTDPDPDAQTCQIAMLEAIRNAGLSVEDIDVVNAHGTSTQANDRTETLALKILFGERAYRVPTHAIKSMIGHAIAAAGALEAIAAVQTLREGIIPPTINYETPDPECDLDYVPNVARQARVDHVLSTSFGFGGQNTALVIGKGS